MQAPRFDPTALRTVLPVADTDVFKALYYDRDEAALRPSLTFVDRSGQIVFETNELGLKGDPLDRQRKLAVVWGDSVVFASGRGWPCLLDQFAPGWQFLNGGLDGDPYSNILRRASEFNRKHPVSLNLLMLGWHPFVSPRAKLVRQMGWLGWRKGEFLVEEPRSGNENVRAALTAFLRANPNTVVATMPTALNPQIIDLDLSAYLVRGDDETGFRFLGDIAYRTEGQRWGYEHIVERNAITREVCAEQRIRMVDLFAMFDTANEADFREHFIDILHLRPRSYRLVAEIVYEEIKDLLA